VKPFWITVFVFSAVALIAQAWLTTVVNGLWLLSIIGLSVAAIIISRGGNND
jgi:hypothetical protein